MIKGFVDAVSNAQVRGWAFSNAHSEPVTIRVFMGSDLIAEGPADEHRDDVQKVHGVSKCGYVLQSEELKALPPEGLADLEVFALDKAGGKQALSPSSGVTGMTRDAKNSASSHGYQSHGAGRSASDSVGKLKEIKLPNLKNKRFLDIGCNEGFFCGEALRQGATRVVGIDKSEKFIAVARERYPEAEFFDQDWGTLPNEKFDVVIMLSALHYEEHPKDLMKRVYDRLTPGGLFILENGCVVENRQKCWVEVPRGVGVVKYPTLPLLLDHILEDFAVRKVGRSVDQPGDPQHRYVFHCRRKTTNYVIIGGPSGFGKTNLGTDLASGRVANLQVDQLLIEQKMRTIRLADATFDGYLQTIDHRNIGLWVDAIEDDDMAERLARFLVNTLPTECDIVCLEGYVFTNRLVATHFNRLMKERGRRVWHTERLA